MSEHDDTLMTRMPAEREVQIAKANAPRQELPPAEALVG
jgi:hypothetical protein